jgi:hypothetical protein
MRGGKIKLKKVCGVFAGEISQRALRRAGRFCASVTQRRLLSVKPRRGRVSQGRRLLNPSGSKDLLLSLMSFFKKNVTLSMPDCGAENA